MVICWLGTLTTPESAWVTKYRLYICWRMKAKAPTLTTKIAVLRVTARDLAEEAHPAVAAALLAGLGEVLALEGIEHVADADHLAGQVGGGDGSAGPPPRAA